MGYVYNTQSIAAPNLDGGMTLYYSDEDGHFQQRDIGRVLTAVSGVRWDNFPAVMEGEGRNG
jgi:hypothetical protein